MMMVSDVAKALGISPKTVYRLIDNGQLSALVISTGEKIRRFRIEEQELERFIRENKT